MLTYAMTALAANKQARLAGQRATFGRVEVDAQRHQRGARRAVTAWLDARCESDGGAGASWSPTITRQAQRARRAATAPRSR